jgi:hypothetical protein
MSWRAVQITDGGVKVTMEHFNTLEEAYKHFQPNIQRQENEGWHLMSLTAVREYFSVENAVYIKIGWNEVLNPEDMEKIESIYVQRVNDFNDAPPQE